MALSTGARGIARFHRLRHSKRDTPGRDPEMLRQVLSYLRRDRYQLLSLVELLRRLDGEGPPLRRAVAFTIDDGYLDQAEIGAPLFAEFDFRSPPS
jgi:peptidoglycan/xylan/chitin deacetylase (PgdA/CDA1 family)